MTRSGKSPNAPQPRGPVFGRFSAAAVAVLVLFLYLQNTSFAGDTPPEGPQGSWRQVHQALGFSLGTPSTTHRKQASIQPSSGHNLLLRLVDSGNNLEPAKDKAYSLREFTAALESISGRPK